MQVLRDGQKRASDPLAVVSHLMWVLETELGFSPRAISAVPKRDFFPLSELKR